MYQPDASGQPMASAEDAIDRAIRALQITFVPEATNGWPIQSARHFDWPIQSARHFATARAPSNGEFIQGFGSGATPERARLRAVMECSERLAQFGRLEPHIATVDSFRSLADQAISPAACGLYSERQYSSPAFGLPPFSEHAPLEWVRVIDLASGVPRLLPVEFLYPLACRNRPRLVVESSSGTAAHFEPAAATLAALCEVIERDSAMLFWYRQPRTVTFPVESIPVPAIRADLRRLQAIGFVVTVCSLVYDLDVPCFLIVALKGDSFACGAGCHPDCAQALVHATTELGQALRELNEAPASTMVYRSLLDVRTPADHYGLYNRGPLHGMLRNVLARTLLRSGDAHWQPVGGAGSVSRELDTLLALLAARGLRAYGCDLTPPQLADSGVHVRRVVVPGLIPIHFGCDRLRLGCRRLWGEDSPGRLSTMLPHFFA